MNIKKVLLHNVLVLNRSWVPIHITTVRAAIGLVFVDAANVIATNDMLNIYNERVCSEFEKLSYVDWISASKFLDDSKYEMLRSSKSKHFKPSVIVLTRYNGVPKYDIKFSRVTIYDRDKGNCQYCGKHIRRSDSTIDHILPKSRGGKNTWNNVTLSCKKCNEFKSDRTPIEADMELLNPPKKPSWVSIKFGKVRTIRERNEWIKFTGSVESEVDENGR